MVFKNMQGSDAPIKEYADVLITIYFFKGTHHFIRCVDEDLVDFENVGDWENPDSTLLSVLCFSQAMYW